MSDISFDTSFVDSTDPVRCWTKLVCFRCQISEGMHPARYRDSAHRIVHSRSPTSTATVSDTDSGLHRICDLASPTYSIYILYVAGPLRSAETLMSTCNVLLIRSLRYSLVNERHLPRTTSRTRDTLAARARASESEPRPRGRTQSIQEVDRRPIQEVDK